MDEFEKWRVPHEETAPYLGRKADLRAAFEAGRRAEREKILTELKAGAGKPLRFCPREIIDAIAAEVPSEG
jgi:hypothetical protein